MPVLRYGYNSSVRIDLVKRPGGRGDRRAAGEPFGRSGGGHRGGAGRSDRLSGACPSTTPGDRVVLAMDRGVPQAASVVAAIVGTLIDAGVEADGISVLQPQAGAEMGEEDPCRLLPEAIRTAARCWWYTTRPTAWQLAYLAADESGTAILVHRRLHEADLIVPVGCLRGGRSGLFRHSYGPLPGLLR